MTNLQESLRRELLRTNRSGAYSASTLVDCNTRKYHGLLVVPVPELDDDNHVLLSSLDCTVIQHGAEFNLGLHKYQGNTFSPNGHKYIREFDASLVPTTTYRVGGVILKKEAIFQAYEDRILIRYTLVDAHSATTLRFRPFLAFRSVRQFTHENMTASREYKEVDHGIKTCMYAGYPDLYMQFSKKNDFVFMPDWYELADIFKMYMKKNQYTLAPDAETYLKESFEYAVAHKDRNFGNARYARNVFEKSIQQQANRLAGQSNLSKEQLTELTVDDLKGGFAARTNIHNN